VASTRARSVSGVQTFLPYPSFAQSVRVLDRARKGKQRVEALQILRAITVPGYGWRNHPAAKMWRGYLPALTKYALESADAWIELGYADTVRPQVLTFAPEVAEQQQEELELPPWVGDPEFHLAHQSNLVRKDPAFYRPLFPHVPDDLAYLWPGATREADGSPSTPTESRGA
jgi:Pyrimidine dimer DNA glycosylase